jgi:hypothetical protein
MKLCEARVVPPNARAAWQDAPPSLGICGVLLAVTVACSHAPQQESRARPAPGVPKAAQTSAPHEASSSAPALPSTGPPSTQAAATPAVTGFSFRRVDPTPVVSLAVGKPPKIALLGAGEALIGDGKGLARVPVGDAPSAELSIEIFFGRDDQPRLMGMRRTSASGKAQAYYRRYKGGRFQPEPSELGPLAGGDGALYGVLGHADPEVVCRPGLFCLVKRMTGWSRAPAHPVPVRVVLAGGSAWALHPDRIERLEKEAWVPVVPERRFGDPVALFVDSDGAPWVVESKSDAVTRLVKGTWETTASPVRGARAIFGSAPNDVWLVGASGAARFDGTGWRDVSGVPGPLSLIAFAAPSLWLAGAAGVFEGTRIAEK